VKDNPQSFLRRRRQLLPIGEDRAGFPTVPADPETDPWDGKDPKRAQRQSGEAIFQPQGPAFHPLVTCKFERDQRVGVVLRGRLGRDVFEVSYSADYVNSTVVVGPGDYEFPCRVLSIGARESLDPGGAPYTVQAQVARM
jgi:hypothetical protein